MVTMLQLLRLSQDANYLNTLSAAARIERMGYSAEIQESLDQLIETLHGKLREIQDPFEMDVQLVIEDRNRVWRQILGIEEMDTVLDLDNN